MLAWFTGFSIRCIHNFNPVYENMTSLTKPEVHNVSHFGHRHQAQRICKFWHLVFEITSGTAAQMLEWMIVMLTVLSRCRSWSVSVSRLLVCSVVNWDDACFSSCSTWNVNDTTACRRDVTSSCCICHNTCMKWSNKPNMKTDPQNFIEANILITLTHIQKVSFNWNYTFYDKKYVSFWLNMGRGY